MLALTGGGELAHLLFPLPGVSKLMGALPRVARLALEGAQQILLSTPLPENGSIGYFLDFNLRIVE